MIDEGIRIDSDLSANAGRKWRCHFIEIDTQALPVPMECAWPDPEKLRFLDELALPAFRHRPALAVGVVQADVDGAVIAWVRATALPRPGIVG